MEFAVIIGGAILALAANTDQVDGYHQIPQHENAGYHQLQVNQAGRADPCANLVAVESKLNPGQTLYFTCNR